MEELKKYDISTLEGLRTFRYDSIDKRTGELISQGFVHNGVTFSMSTNAQSNLLGSFSAKDSLTYPFSWNAKDDSSTYAIADAAEMTTFFMTALGTKKAHQDSGSALKNQVREGIDIAAVLAIVDAR